MSLNTAACLPGAIIASFDCLLTLHRSAALLRYICGRTPRDTVTSG